MIDEEDARAAGQLEVSPEPIAADTPATSALDRLEQLDSPGIGDALSRRERRRQRREKRWTRPVVRDWRWGVRLVGRSLIVIGLLMFGFVGYQLWGTGIETSRAQNRLENEFEDLLAEVQASEDDTTTADEPPTDDADTGQSSTGADGQGGGQGQGQDGGRGQGQGQGQGGDQRPGDGDGSATDEGTAGDNAEPSGRVETVQVGDGPIRRDLPPLSPGDPIGKVEIPEIGLDFMMVEGVSTSNLKEGIGHYPDTPQPGQLGNAALAGHRTTYGNPLLNADELGAGDRITLTTLAGTFVYNVTESFVVGPSDYWVVGTEDEEVASLTVTTCHPAWSASQRLVIRAELDPNASDEIFVADPVDEGDDATTDEEEQPARTTAPEGDDPVIGGGGDDGVDGEATPGGNAEFVPSEGGVDAFEQGWFSDSGAWPHVALWAALLAALATVGYLISRFFRRYWVGTLICVLPFLVTLYFFYQNVNRLLPPAL